MPRWLGYGLLAIAMWGGWGLIGKLTRLNEWQMTALSTIGVVGVAALLLFSPRLRQGTDRRRGMAIAFVTGIFGNLGNLAYLKALKVGEASLVAPYTALYPLVTVVLARAVLRERMNRVQAVGFALAIVAAGLFSYLGGGEVKQGVVLGSWMAWASVTVACFGIAAVTQKVATMYISNELSLVCFAAAFVPVGAAILLWGGPFDWALPRREWIYAILYGSGIGLGTLVLFAAYRWGNASVVTALTGLYPALTAALAMVIPAFGESFTGLKLVAIALAALAGAALTFEKKPDA
jgi:transporter family protein